MNLNTQTLAALVTLSLIFSAGCSYETLKDVSRTTNEATDHVGEGQYTVDPLDRIGTQ